MIIIFFSPNFYAQLVVIDPKGTCDLLITLFDIKVLKRIIELEMRHEVLSSSWTDENVFYLEIFVRNFLGGSCLFCFSFIGECLSLFRSVIH